MTYLKMVIKGGQRGSEVGKEGFFLYETAQATAGQELVVLHGKYRPGEYELEIYLNGFRQTYLNDYLEIDVNTVQFLEPLEAGDDLLFLVRKSKSNTVLHEVHDGIAGQTTIKLSNPYHPGRGTLMVFDNGQLRTLGEDYVETDEHTVTFTKPFNDKPHKITFHEVV